MDKAEYIFEKIAGFEMEKEAGVKVDLKKFVNYVKSLGVSTIELPKNFKATRAAYKQYNKVLNEIPRYRPIMNGNGDFWDAGVKKFKRFKPTPEQKSAYHNDFIRERMQNEKLMTNAGKTAKGLILPSATLTIGAAALKPSKKNK